MSISQNQLVPGRHRSIIEILFTSKEIPRHAKCVHGQTTDGRTDGRPENIMPRLPIE